MTEILVPSVEWRNTDEGIRPWHPDHAVAWAPQPGSQQVFLDCPIFEVLYEGTRGGGKTDTLLMDYCQHVGQGWGIDWKGILFRHSYKDLEDVVTKSQKWFPRIWPYATYNESKMFWGWPTGEKLIFSYLEKERDYKHYHGHEYPWIAFEELTTWPDDKAYKVLMSCCRSSRFGMPRKFRATTNPYGVGHNHVKARFNLPITRGRMIGDTILGEPDAKTGRRLKRVAIHSSVEENRILLDAQPDYLSQISEAARNPSERKAWLYGSWDITAGGMFDDLWDPEVHVVPNFSFTAVPRTWKMSRSYDHGQSAPFSVCWWAESNGEPLRWEGVEYGQVPGDSILIAEWYGWNGTPNEGLRMDAGDIAKGILDRENDWGLAGLVKKGPADSSIFDDYSPGKSVAGDMKRKGVRWTHADKGPGSRKQGWEQLRKLLRGAIPTGRGTREVKGMFVCDRCAQFLRTFPVLPRDEKKDLDDVDTDSEDHIGDSVRYKFREKSGGVSIKRW